MSATVFGEGTYGTSDETSTGINLYTASVAMSATSNAVWMPNHIADETGVAIGNKGATLSLGGMLSVADNLGTAIAAALTAADIANSDVFANSTGVTTFYVLSQDITRNNAGFQEGSINLEGRDGLTDTTGVVVS